MKYALIIVLFLVTACSKKAADQVSATASVAGSCQLQSVVPAPQYGTGISLKTYLCSQYRPSCFYHVLSSVALDEVPAIVDTNCAPSEVPPSFR